MLEGITFFDEVFEPGLCRHLLQDSRKALHEGNQFSRSNFHWDKGIVRGSQPVLIRDYDEVTSRFILGKLAEKGIATGQDYAVMNFAWSRMSYIPWHNDDHVGEAISIYLNEEWDPNWGGLFLYKQPGSELIHGREPKFNTGLRNTQSLFHCTTPVAIDAPEPRFTLQLFRQKR